MHIYIYTYICVYIYIYTYTYILYHKPYQLIILLMLLMIMIILVIVMVIVLMIVIIIVIPWARARWRGGSSLYLSLSLYVCIYIYIYAHTYHISISLSIYLSVCLSIYLSIYLYVQCVYIYIYIYIYSLQLVAPIAQLFKDRRSDAGGPSFECQAGRVTGKSTPGLWRNRHPAIKGLWPPEHHAGQFLPAKKDSADSKQTNTNNDICSGFCQTLFAESGIRSQKTSSSGFLFDNQSTDLFILVPFILSIYEQSYICLHACSAQTSAPPRVSHAYLHISL